MLVGMSFLGSPGLKKVYLQSVSAFLFVCCTGENYSINFYQFGVKRINPNLNLNLHQILQFEIAIILTYNPRRGCRNCCNLHHGNQ